MTSLGILLLTLANAVYILGGWVLTVALAHQLGPHGFGSYGVVASVVTMIQMIVARGVPVAASRRIAATPDSAAVIMRTTTRLMVRVSLGFLAIFVVAAWPLAALLGDHALRVPLQIGACAAISFAVNAVVQAYINGRHEFRAQGLGMAWYGLVRVATIVGGAVVAGLDGALLGFIAAPVIGTLPMVRRWQGSEPVAGGGDHDLRRSLLRDSVPLLVTASSVLLLLTVDLLAFKRVGSSRDVGAYAAAGTLAHVPYFLLQAAGIALLPGVAAAASDDARRLVVSRGLSDTIVMLALPVAVLVGLGSSAYDLIFGARYATGAGVVAPLTLATAGVTFHGTFVAIDAGMHRLRAASVLGLGGVVVMACGVLIAGSGSHPVAAAWAAAATVGAVALVHGLLLARRLGAILEPRRVLIALALAAGIGVACAFVPSSLVAIGGASLALSAAYVLVAWRGQLLSVWQRQHMTPPVEPPNLAE